MDETIRIWIVGDTIKVELNLSNYDLTDEHEP